MFMKKYWSLILLLIILGLAGFVRLWQLEQIPPSVYFDEAVNGMDAIELVEGGQFKPFYPANGGREGLFINLIGLSFKLGGISVFSLRVISAIAGILTVLGLYLLAGQLFNRRVALSSSFLLAVSFWHINFSRIGFRAILLPLVLVFLFYFLVKAYQTKSIWYLILAGLFLGLGFYTYLPYWMIFLILPFFLYEYSKIGKYRLGCFKILILALIAIVVVLPLAIYFFHQPPINISAKRLSLEGLSVFSKEGSIKFFFLNIIRTLGMFHFKGDGNWRHNLVAEPMLFWPVGLLFILGIIIIVFKRRNYFLLVWLVAMLIPAILAWEELPHPSAIRTIGTIIPIYLLAGLGFVFIFEKTRLLKSKAVKISLILILVSVSIFNFNKYFFDWARQAEVKKWFSGDLNRVGVYLNNLPTSVQGYLITNKKIDQQEILLGRVFPRLQLLEFITYQENRIQYLAPEEIKTLSADKRMVFVVLFPDEEFLANLKKKFPQGEVKKYGPRIPNEFQLFYNGQFSRM